MNFPKQLISSIGLAIPLALGASALQAQTVTLKFTHFLPSTSNFQKNVAEPWCAAIEKDSGGRLKCQLYPSLQLGGTPAQIADQVKKIFNNYFGQSLCSIVNGLQEALSEGNIPKGYLHHTYPGKSEKYHPPA